MDCLGEIMKKLAILFAAGLLVSAPLVAATPTDTYAAAKKKAKPVDPNLRFAAALDDLGKSLAKGHERKGKK